MHRPMRGRMRVATSSPSPHFSRRSTRPHSPLLVLCLLIFVLFTLLLPAVAQQNNLLPSPNLSSPHHFVGLTTTDPSTLTPLAASVLSLARQFPPPQPLTLPSLPLLLSDHEEKEQMRLTTGEKDNQTRPKSTFRHRGSMKLAVRESVDLTQQLHSGAVSLTPTADSEQEEEREEEVTPDLTFITSVADDTSLPPAVWYEQSTLEESIASLPSFESTCPPLPPSLSLPHLLSLTTSSSFLPSTLFPLLTSPLSLSILHNLFFFTLLHLAGDAEHELTRYAEWEEGRKRGTVEVRREVGERKVGKKGRDEPVRYTRYGDEEEEVKEEKVEQVVVEKKERRANQEYGPFVPSHPPILGPSPFGSAPFYSSHPQSSSLSLIFSRLSSLYLSLFTQPSPHHLDLFFSSYPDCAAESLYHAFVHVFPHSIKRLDTPLFRSRLSRLVSWLCSGYAPHSNEWEKWRIGGKVEEKRRASQIRGGGRSAMSTASTARLPPLPPSPPSVQLMQRRRATIGHSPLIAHFLSTNSLAPSTSLSLSLPLSFPVRLSPALLSSLSLVPPPPEPVLSVAKKEFRALRRVMEEEERREGVEGEGRVRQEEKERAVAMRTREDYARALVRDSQANKYRALKLQSKHLSLKRLSLLKGSGGDEEEKADDSGLNR